VSGRAATAAWACALIAFAVAGCNGSLKFSDGDAGADACAGGSCSWRNDGCDAELCALTCPAATICAGSCDECAVTCEQQSQCSLMVSESPGLTCLGGASCVYVLGLEAHLVDCQAGSTCSARCAGTCTLTCGAGATCKIQCGSAAMATTVTSGSASCP
jgi:hypothetical protein